MSAITSAAERLPLLGTKGIAFQETMSGYHELKEGPRKGERLPFAFDARAQSRTIPAFFGMGGGVIALDGEVRAEGLAKKTAMRGTVKMDLTAKIGLLTYDFDFVGDDGKQYHFHGTKNRQGLNLTKSFTTLYGKVIRKETGEAVSEGITYFNLKELPAFLRSYKLV